MSTPAAGAVEGHAEYQEGQSFELVSHWRSTWLMDQLACADHSDTPGSLARTLNARLAADCIKAASGAALAQAYRDICALQLCNHAPRFFGVDPRRESEKRSESKQALTNWPLQFRLIYRFSPLSLHRTHEKTSSAAHFQFRVPYGATTVSEHYTGHSQMHVEAIPTTFRHRPTQHLSL